MIEIQCTSCHTRYRIDERVLPEDTPTFKCSRCGHVFSADPVRPRAKKSVARETRPPEPPTEEPPTEKPADEEPPARPRADASALLKPALEPVQKRPGPGDTEPAAPLEDPLARLERTFERGDDRTHTGDNLSFDFSAEGGGPVHHEPEAEEPVVREERKWEVGEPPAEPQPPPECQRRRRRILSIEEPDPLPRFSSPPPAEQPVVFERTQLPVDVEYVASGGGFHSSVAFLGIFFVFATAFGVASVLICGEPIASARLLGSIPSIGERFQRPIVPAMLVAMSGVKADYRSVKGGHRALVVSGTAQNVGPHRLRVIQIAVVLMDFGRREIAGQAAFCGNSLSEKMIGEMTPREIEFLQRLDPQRNFALEPSRTAPFVLIFIDPPHQVASLRIAVTRADGGPGAARSDPGT